MTLRDFLVSAGFGGLAAVVAALILALIAFFAARRAARRDELQSEQQERHHQQTRDDERRDAALSRCWQRLVWVVETAGLEPAANEHATLGLGPELALELLRGLLRDAEQLGDETLAKSVAVYLNQFSLVLAQQAGPLSQFAVAPSPRKETREVRHEQPTQQAAPAAADEQPTESVTAEPASEGRRRRR